MDIKQIYREETNLEPYTESPNYEDHFSNDYVKWLEAKINYTRCSTQLKDKEAMTFEDWTKNQGYKQDFFYFKKDKEYLKPTEVLQKYNRYKQNL